MDDLYPKQVKFAARVQVVAADGRWLFTVHGQEAKRLLRSGTVRPQGKEHRLGVVELIESLAGLRKRPCSPASIQIPKYVYRERLVEGEDVVATVLQFRYINPKDRPLFRLAVTDCLVATP